MIHGDDGENNQLGPNSHYSKTFYRSFRKKSDVHAQKAMLDAIACGVCCLFV